MPDSWLSGGKGTTIVRSNGSACSNQRSERPTSPSSKAKAQSPHRSIQRFRRNCGRGCSSAGAVVLAMVALLVLQEIFVPTDQRARAADVLGSTASATFTDVGRFQRDHMTAEVRHGPTDVLQW